MRGRRLLVALVVVFDETHMGCCWLLSSKQMDSCRNGALSMGPIIKFEHLIPVLVLC